MVEELFDLIHAPVSHKGKVSVPYESSHVAHEHLEGDRVMSSLLLSIVVLPVNPTAYIPKALFGSLLIFIAIDLLSEWLWNSYAQRFSSIQYAVCLTSWFIMTVVGVQFGIFLAVILEVVANWYYPEYAAGEKQGHVSASNESEPFLEVNTLQQHKNKLWKHCSL